MADGLLVCHVSVQPNSGFAFLKSSKPQHCQYPFYAEYHQLMECTQSYLVAVPRIGVAKPLDVVEDEPGEGDDHENNEGDGDKHY